MDYMNTQINKLYNNIIDIFLNWKMHLRETLWAIFIALILRTTVINIYKIPTPSMVPTIKVKDILIGNHFYYGLKLPFTDGKKGYRLPGIKNPDIGDFIIFRSPQEAIFWKIDLMINNDEGSQILSEINKKASKYKNPINIQNNFTNNIYIHDAHRKNLYFLEKPIEKGNIIQILIPEQLYQQYISSFTSKTNKFSIDENFTIISKNSHQIPLTFSKSADIGIFKSLLHTPVSGLSIIYTALIRSPFYIPSFLFTMQYKLKKHKNFTYLKQMDTSKMYVKRLIAKEGDTIQIINKRVYINGKLLSRSYEYDPDMQELGYDPEAKIYKETIVYSKKNTIKTNIFPVRFSDSYLIRPIFQFNPQYFPYDPQFTAQFFRDNFGPITVPEGHYFAMGDNRDESYDCRFFGFIPEYEVKSYPLIRIWPFNRFGKIKYNFSF